MEWTEIVRCKKCRKILLPQSKCKILDAHGREYSLSACEGETTRNRCMTVEESSCLYIPEDCYPESIISSIDESSWTKGKINCPECNIKIGSFNFVSGGRCACGSYLLPAVHFQKSKVDWMKGKEALACKGSILKKSFQQNPSMTYSPAESTADEKSDFDCSRP